MLKQRIFTAIAMVAVFLGMLIYLSPLLFSVLIMLLVLVAGWEWAHLLKISSTAGRAGYLGLLLLSLLVCSHSIGLYSVFDFELGRQISLVAVGLWAIIFLWIQGYPSSAILWSPKPVLGLIGLLLLVATWAAVASILHADNGAWLLLLAIAIIVLADVGGYIAGNLLGKHKLAPIISPGKTWEGFAGGLLLQLPLIAALLWLLPDTEIKNWLILVFPVALYSVLGDLFESMVKRQSGVKDSSQLLPGHGGVLDRIDGIMAGMPLFALLLSQLSLR
jgi:phosphatidate cytidylyltransferase